MLPTPFIYVTAPASIDTRLGRVGDFSAHVYIAYENNILMLRHGNVTRSGGTLNPDETVLTGLTRILNEEMPVFTDFILSRLRNAVGMWCQTEEGVHNTFLIEAKPTDFDVWAKCAELRREKETSNRSDGELVLVPLEPMVKSISDWKHSGQVGDPKIECYVDAMERNFLPFRSNFLPLRNVIVPVVGELKTLLRLARTPVIHQAFATTQAYYKYFANNAMMILDNDPISRVCVSCGVDRTARDDFARSKYAIMCNACGNHHALSMRELRRIEDQLESADLVVLACKIIEYYETLAYTVKQ